MIRATLCRNAALALMLATAIGMGGCATPKSVREAKEMAQHAQETADQALGEAKRANDKADAVDEKVNRMFQSSVRK